MHDRKKGGERKDKKNKRMHEASDLKHALHDREPDRTATDQPDVVNFKPGSGSDANRRHIQPRVQKD